MTTPRVWYLPTPVVGWPVDRQVEAGLAWLHSQPGPWWVLAEQHTSTTDTRLLSLSHRTNLVAPAELRAQGSAGGAVLAAWPSEDALALLSTGAGVVAPEVRVCVLERGFPAWLNSWLRAHSAVDARFGNSYPGAAAHLLPPRVESALRNCGDIAATGLGFDPVMVWAWALAHGYPPSRARLLRDAATTALAQRGGAVIPCHSRRHVWTPQHKCG